MNTNDYRQEVTYWGPASTDGWGTPSFGAPTLLMCRWQESTERFIDGSGVEVLSRAKVWSKVDLETGGYLKLGDHTSETNPTQLEECFIIRRFNKIPDLRAMFFERVSML